MKYCFIDKNTNGIIFIAYICKNDICIKYLNKEIIFSDCRELSKFIKVSISERDVDVLAYWETEVVSTYQEAILSITIAKIIPEITCIFDKRKYHLTFSYAFPIALCDMNVISRVISNLDEVISVNALVYSITNIDFCVTERQDLVIDKLFKKNKFKSKRFLDIKYKKNFAIDDIWGRYIEYCKKRFDINVGDDEINLYKKIFYGKCFYVNEFYLDDKWVCSTLLYQNDVYKILYNILVPWNLDLKEVRPGIVSLLINLKEANRIGYLFSMCYGGQAYKERILRELPKKSVIEIKNNENDFDSD